ncbi:dihydrolipoamide dehydrogenase [Beutenbergia cavernae DSM 12333]|uniref:Dihydrolipoyl dehydrogenase n=1 Tax=Beutenbergia cavernae (strain ATCC BAA-8 / DSM 12333 / CCUG 43141 / JCM 11478 / NBRC 16432 / NCIMB 13614 / HKI 0122) TaxID=471853 RepID=C5C4Z1_BEUC1|nr:dihydrolipoamide dehydrogenase [Beutenbergia cavernae DSM 12333]
MAPSAPADAGERGDATYDVVVLGGGSGGYAAALRAAQLDLRVALVESDKVGGTCLHRGCIPTKALLHSAEVADAVRESATFGVRASLDGIDMAAVTAYQEGVVARLYKGLQGLVAGRGIEVVAGHGRLVAPDAVEVAGRTIRGRNVVVATGSYSRSLPGLEIGGRVVTSDQALRLDWVPQRVVVLGGGVIGVEFASLWRSFGAEVTVVEALEHLVPNEDVALSTALERAFRKRGIGMRLGARFAGVDQDDSGVRVHLEDSDDVLAADLLLVAVGRGPATAGVGLEQQGVELDRGFVVTDERLRTTTSGVYAVGDVVAGLQLAHRGFAQGIFVAEEIAGLAPAPIVESGIPRVTYSDPEIASVGLTEAQARDRYGDGVETLEYNLGGNGRSQILRTAGFVKLVRAPEGPIVGVHAIGARMGEQVGEGQLIVNWEAFPEDVAALVHAHPTQNEALGEAALALAGKPLHAHH